ncbi:beta-alanine-activating enzyme [Malaya genurostris]|uniref:beta-alanine-activating enzyme n=1 Tax=Malaya genurostris TaxID=325434 RepID=UPI0026F3D0B0|nr:beta-alanine-activating enzyme [Malaya genurostris]
MLDIDAFRRFSTAYAIIYHSSNERKISFTYTQLLTAVTSVKQVIETQKLVGHCFGVFITHSPALIAVVIGINYSESVFYCLNANYNIPRVIEELIRVGSCYCFCLDKDVVHFSKTESNFRILNILNLLDENIALLQFISDVSSTKAACGIAYYIGTSGSTGQPKLVKVPNLCIQPNLEKLKDLLQVTQDDRLFVSSPSSFDPFVVDVFLAVRNGACLILVTNEIRLDSERLLGVLFVQDRVTIMQLTPSLFQRWNEQSVADVILRKDSSLRHLVLGGEPFPVQMKIPDQTSTAIHNIYGITEISCWATIETVNPKIVGGDISLGLPLDCSIELQLRQVDDNDIVLSKNQEAYPLRGQLFVGSRTRKCVVNDEPMTTFLATEEVLYRGTGDLVELRQDSKFYYLGRCDELVKRFGTRVSLVCVEQMADRCHGVRKSCAVFDELNHKLVLFYTTNDKSDHEASITEKLKTVLCNEMMPDEFIEIKTFPLCKHGKIDRKSLVGHYRKHCEQQKLTTHSDIRETFNEQIYKLLGVGCANSHKSKRQKWDGKISFLDAGGTSIQAIQLTTFLQDYASSPIPHLIGLLLDKAVSLTDIASYLDETTHLISSNSSKAINVHAVKDSMEISIGARFNMNKCIDASPTTFYSKIHNRNFLAVGSHSHKVVVVDTQSDQIVSELILPDRIESAVSYLTDQEHGFVGCYDGFLYCFDVLTSNILWKFSSGGMIKGRALVSDSLIVFGSYAEEYNLFALEYNGTLVWKTRIGSKGILSSPLALHDRFAFVATLDGTCLCFTIKDGFQNWSKKLNSPVFANCSVVEHLQLILVAEVQGVIHCFTSQNGEELWSVSTDGNIFSTPIVQQQSDDSVRILLGCHDKHLYCFSFTNNSACEGAKLVWKIRLQSPIYSGPVLLDDDLIIVCSTSGYINLVSLTSTQVVTVIKLGGEIFSTAVVVDSNTFYIGCRDNTLYKLDKVNSKGSNQ